MASAIRPHEDWLQQAVLSDRVFQLDKGLVPPRSDMRQHHASENRRATATPLDLLQHWQECAERLGRKWLWADWHDYIVGAVQSMQERGRVSGPGVQQSNVPFLSSVIDERQ